MPMHDFNPPHDGHDPQGYMNALEAAVLAARLTPCPHCMMHRMVVAMSGNGWGVATDTKSVVRTTRTICWPRAGHPDRPDAN